MTNSICKVKFVSNYYVLLYIIIILTSLCCVAINIYTPYLDVTACTDHCMDQINDSMLSYHQPKPYSSICLCNATRLCKLVMKVNNSAPCSGAHVSVQSSTSALCNWMNLVFLGRKRTLQAGITDTLSHIHVNADGHFWQPSTTVFTFSWCNVTKQHQLWKMQR